MDQQQELIEKYKVFLNETQNKGENYKWDAIEHFQNTWDIEAGDFQSMFNDAFKKQWNLIYQNSWGFIKKAIEYFPEQVREMFKNLYEEEIDLQQRILSFQKTSELLLTKVKEAVGKEKLNHQQDERTISVYLAFRFPERYYIYKNSVYTDYCVLIGEKMAPSGEKYIHFSHLADDFKENYVLKDKELIQLHKSIHPVLKWDETNLIVQNIIYRMLTVYEKESNINSYLEQFAEIADDWFDDSPFLEERFAFFQEFKKRENLENADWPYFQQLGGKINAFETNALARTRALGNINHAIGSSNVAIENYRENFIDLIYGKDSIDIRMDRFISNVPFFSNSSVSELVGQFFPEDYVFFNKQDQQGIKTLGIDLKFKKGDSFGKKFVKFNKEIEPIFEDYKNLVGLRTNTTIRLEFDQFLRFVSNLDIKNDEEDLLNAFEEIGDENIIRSYFDYLTNIFFENDVEVGDTRFEFTCPKNKKGGLVVQLDHRYLYAIERRGSRINNYMLIKPSDLDLLKTNTFFKDFGIFKSNTKDEEAPYGVGFEGELNKFPFVSKEQLDRGLKYQLAKTPFEFRNSRYKTNDAFEECINNTKKLDELLKRVFKNEVHEPEHIYKDQKVNYYWLNANPKQWSIDELEHNPEIEYTTNTERGTKRRIYKYMRELKPGDIVIGYESTPVKKIKAILEVSKSIYRNEEDQEVFEMRLVNFTPLQPTWEELKANSILQHSEVFTNNQGSLFKLTRSEYEEILNHVYAKPKYESYLKKDLLSEVFISPLKLERALSLLKRKKNIILQGPPGTGKTYFAKRLGYCLMGEKDTTRLLTIQFHQSYSYEDFIQGYRPVNGQLTLKNGIFYDFAKKATRDPGRDYIIIIDEINRGNLSKIFGELMLLLESDKRGEKIKLTYAMDESELFTVPNNLHIIGTMNTADRSLALVDYALRRRFAFISMEPHFDDYFTAYLSLIGFEQEVINGLVEKISAINSLIMGDPSLKEGFLIGHSYFVAIEKPNDPELWISEIINYEILPLLEEYWFDNDERLNEAKNILGLTE